MIFKLKCKQKISISQIINKAGLSLRPPNGDIRRINLLIPLPEVYQNIQHPKYNRLTNHNKIPVAHTPRIPISICPIADKLADPDPNIVQTEPQINQTVEQENSPFFILESAYLNQIYHYYYGCEQVGQDECCYVYYVVQKLGVCQDLPALLFAFCVVYCDYQQKEY